MDDYGEIVPGLPLLPTTWYGPSLLAEEESGLCLSGGFLTDISLIRSDENESWLKFLGISNILQQLFKKGGNFPEA